jgi:cytochrome P450
MVILNSFATASALLRDKGANYSDRQRSRFLGELVGWGQQATMLDDGPAWRAQRKLFTHWIGTKASVEMCDEVLEERARRFVCRLLDDQGTGGKMFHHMRT